MSSPGETGDDADVITASLRHPERFAVVFDRHAPHIHRYFARRLGSQVADDLMGETFLIAFGGRGRYDPAFPSARPWLYGIATNLVGQRRREEAREYRLRAALGPPAEQDGHADRVAERVTAQAMNERLAGALAGLAKGGPGRARADRLGGPDVRRGRRCAGDPGRHGPVALEPGSPEGPDGTRARARRGGLEPWMRCSCFTISPDRPGSRHPMSWPGSGPN